MSPEDKTTEFPARMRSPFVAWIWQRWYADLNPRRAFISNLKQDTEHGRLRVLDVGCGFELRTLRRVSGFRVGVDIALMARGPDVHAVQADATALPFRDAQFDLVYCTSVLEHVTEPSELFREVARVLRSGGRFRLLTPNKWDYISIAAALLPNRFHPALVRRITGRPEHHTFPTYYRANTVRAIHRLSQEAGLTVEYCERVRQHPHYLKGSRAAYLIGVCVEQTLQRPFAALRPWLVASLRR